MDRGRARRLAGMAEVLAPVHHLGLAATGTLFRDLLRLGRTWGPEAARFLRQVAVRRWRSLETGGEALWACLTGVHLAGIMTAEGIDHIHAPWADGPATAAWVASGLSGIPFSFCAHAQDIYPPDGALLEKLSAAAFIRTENRSNLRYLSGLFPQTAGKMVNIYPGAPLTKAQVATNPGLSALPLAGGGTVRAQKRLLAAVGGLPAAGGARGGFSADPGGRWSGAASACQARRGNMT